MTITSRRQVQDIPKPFVAYFLACHRCDMTLDSRSTKRRRVSASPKTITIIAPRKPRKPGHGQEQFTRHADFWLDDGNLILLAGDTAFRVYQSLLTKSSAVFADMFAFGYTDATETFDGCPVVRLPDHPDDLRDFLQYIMPCSELRYVLFFPPQLTTASPLPAPPP